MFDLIEKSFAWLTFDEMTKSVFFARHDSFYLFVAHTVHRYYMFLFRWFLHCRNTISLINVENFISIGYLSSC